MQSNTEQGRKVTLVWQKGDREITSEGINFAGSLDLTNHLAQMTLAGWKLVKKEGGYE